jgi:hypothetical protein
VSKSVRIQNITPEFVKDVDPKYIGEVVKRLIEGEETPFGILIIATREEADKFAEHNLWMYGNVQRPASALG